MAQQRAASAAERAAKAAESQRDAAWWQIGLTAAGTFALIWTLVLNRQSVREARRAAQAAVDAVAFERAWLTPAPFMSGLSPDVYVDGTYYSTGYVMMLGWKNTGRSPAVRVDIYADEAFIKPGDSIPTFHPPQPPGDRAGIFGPEFVGFTRQFHVVGAKFDEVKNRKVFWIIYSRATYGSTINPERVFYTETCVQVDFNGEREHQGRRVLNVSNLAVGPQNTAT